MHSPCLPPSLLVESKHPKQGRKRTNCGKTNQSQLVTERLHEHIQLEALTYALNASSNASRRNVCCQNLGIACCWCERRRRQETVATSQAGTFGCQVSACELGCRDGCFLLSRRNTTVLLYSNFNRWLIYIMSSEHLPRHEKRLLSSQLSAVRRLQSFSTRCVRHTGQLGRMI